MKTSCLIKIHLRLLVPAALLAIPLRARTEDFEGADAILKAMEAHRMVAHPAGNEVLPEPAGDTQEKLKGDLDAFRKSTPTLPPEEAARQWLVLAGRFAEISRKMRSGGYVTLTWSGVLAALPPPAAWPALAKAVDTPPTKVDSLSIALRLIAHRLVNDNAALNKDFDDFHDYLEKDKSAVADVYSSLQEPDGLSAADHEVNQLREVLADDSNDGDAILKQLEMSLAHPRVLFGHESGDIDVPDLVSLVGEEKATTFLRKTLASDVVIRLAYGEDTARLARKLALQMLPVLKAPQWRLADSMDSMGLFEGMEKRFPKPTNPNTLSDYNSVRSYYVLGLIAAHRSKEALAIAKDLDHSQNFPSTDDLERAGLTTDVADFFHDLLSENPKLPYWDDYLGIALKAGGQKKMIALLETCAARPGIPEYKRIEFERYLARVYLAVDRVDDAIAEVRKQIADAAKMATDSVEEGWNVESRRDGELKGLGLSLAKLGGLLGRADLEDEGIRVAEDALQRSRAAAARNGLDESDISSEVEGIANTLMELGRGPQSEAVLKDALAHLPSGLEAGDSGRKLIVDLMGIYDRAGRFSDVLVLLDRAPCWNAKDLSQVLTASVTADRNEDYAGYFAANALAAKGRNDEARKILDALLNAESDYDPAYELLLKIVPHDDALARLDALFARDPFEPRPLIWKAKLLLDAGKLDEAEATARRAVAIDPSDGGHGPGRRMRVYSVLADILQARGDKTGAENYRGFVTAIRHSEDADRFYEAGLITRAVAMYNEALTHFADAYCIQSRLAQRMEELGNMEGAEKHYRRAFELMPGSFGRVEDHCLGCEGAFSGYRAQDIARQVFSDFAKAHPEKPQAHYLLANLRDQQGDKRGALAELREAVKLDPDYLVAWRMISDISRELLLPKAERDAASINLIRLDPLGRHAGLYQDSIADLAAGWNALASSAKSQPPAPGPLYPLKASAEAVAGQPVVDEPDFTRIDPSSVVTDNSFIEAATGVFDTHDAPDSGQ